MTHTRSYFVIGLLQDLRLLLGLFDTLTLTDTGGKFRDPKSGFTLFFISHRLVKDFVST
jgi:hypothetical protein